MSKKEKCKQVMEKLFGIASAQQVDEFTEDECVEKCKNKVRMFLGSEIADKEFSSI